MWRLAVLVPLALAAAGCGGGGKPLAETARPCLERLGQYVHHTAEPDTRIDDTPRLPVLDPDNPPRVNETTRRLPVPDDFQEYGEVLYPPSNPGANAVQVLIFGDEELPKRVVEITRRMAGAPQSGALPAAVQVRRVGQTILLWSSQPSPRQTAAVAACLD
jgi:hypothetical protein